jgi:hypothetical protein
MKKLSPPPPVAGVEPVLMKKLSSPPVVAGEEPVPMKKLSSPPLPVAGVEPAEWWSPTG